MQFKDANIQFCKDFTQGRAPFLPAFDEPLLLLDEWQYLGGRSGLGILTRWATWICRLLPEDLQQMDVLSSIKSFSNNQGSRMAAGNQAMIAAKVIA